MASSSVLRVSFASVASGARSRRVVAGIVAIACTGVLGLAAWLPPSTSGVGTHQALNMPPCGWVAIADFPCPTCGMTTAFAHAANGDLVASFIAQPMGCALALATAMTLFISVYVAVTGSRLGHSFTRLWGGWSPWLLAGAVVAAWGFKIISYKGWV